MLVDMKMIIKSNAYEIWNENASLKKSISARTTGRLNRAVKKAPYPDMEEREWAYYIPKKHCTIKLRRTTFSISTWQGSLWY